jgi:hypothetical protein
MVDLLGVDIHSFPHSFPQISTQLSTADRVVFHKLSPDFFTTCGKLQYIADLAVLFVEFSRNAPYQKRRGAYPVKICPPS